MKRRGGTVNYKYYLFDLDGTLTDSGIGITNSVMYALEKFNIHVSDREELYPFIGPPLADSFMKYYGFTEGQALQAIGYYREYFRAGGIFENRVYEGIPEMLGALKDRNAIVALATSKPYEFSVQILEHFDLRRYFDHVGAASMDGRISNKADVIRHLIDELGDIDAESVLMIGDRDQDVDGAKANGLHCAGVLWGYGSRGELLDAGADYLASVPSDILKI